MLRGLEDVRHKLTHYKNRYFYDTMANINVLQRDVCSAVQCNFGPFLAPYFTVQFSHKHNCTAPHFAVTCAVQYNAAYKMHFEAHNTPII